MSGVSLSCFKFEPAILCSTLAETKLDVWYLLTLQIMYKVLVKRSGDLNKKFVPGTEAVTADNVYVLNVFGRW